MINALPNNTDWQLMACKYVAPIHPMRERTHAKEAALDTGSPLLPAGGSGFW